MGCRRVSNQEVKHLPLTDTTYRSGLAGSYFYGEQLTEKEADSIRFYFNYDMIGSPKPQYWVQASKPADRVGGDILAAWLRKKGKKVEWE